MSFTSAFTTVVTIYIYIYHNIASYHPTRLHRYTTPRTITMDTTPRSPTRVRLSTHPSPSTHPSWCLLRKEAATPTHTLLPDTTRHPSASPPPLCFLMAAEKDSLDAI